MKHKSDVVAFLLGLMAATLLFCGCASTGAQETAAEADDSVAQQQTAADDEAEAEIVTDEDDAEAIDNAEDADQAELEPLTAEQTIEHAYGNTASNIWNGGIFLTDAYGFAFLYNMYTDTVCRIDMETGLTTTLYDGNLLYLNLSNGVIYGYDGAESSIVSVGCYTGITSTLVDLGDLSIFTIQLVDDTLYISTNEGELYTLPTDGGALELLLTGAYYPQIYQGAIIYQNDDDQEYLYSMNLTSGETTKLNESHSHFLIPYQDVVYYVRVVDDSSISICSVPLDGSCQETVVVDGYAAYMNIYNDTLYYLDESWYITTLDLTDADAEPVTLDLDDQLTAALKESYGESSVSSLAIQYCSGINLSNGYMEFGCAEIINGSEYIDVYLYDMANDSIIVVEAFCFDLDGLFEELLELMEESASTTTSSSSSTSNSSSRTSYPAGTYSVGSVYGPKLSQSELDEVADAVEKFLSLYDTSSMDDYTKVLTAHDYLCSICSYAASWSQNGANTAWGALVYGEAQCSGYARAMKALCDAMGVGCYYVHADDNASNPSHQWNEVCVDGSWYIVDVQCNDTSGYKAFFLVSDSTYKDGSGMSWDTSAYPACPNDY